MGTTAPASGRYSVIHGGRQVMLDHMLVSRPLFNRNSSVHIHNDLLNDELLDYRRGEHLAESHHAPIVAGFEF